MVEPLISSSLPLALSVLLLVSGTAHALDQSESSPHPDLASRAVVEGAGGGPDLVGSDDALAESTLSAEFSGPERLDRKDTMPSLKIRLGRTSAFGRSPGAAPPAYGEVGINLAPLPGLSLVPSYQVVLDDDSEEGSGAVSGQVLKFGARIPF